ncbi:MULTISPECIES: lipoate--protein ligase [unclassified Exiguobacterium]|uniref:lipoate--protein ligase n=1 Tax=unclassified Exiguobacterium TaxID=2644629 RepID=UPI00103B84B9|nr:MULTISPECIES: lipoate--protein ligase [unclassified Exiguobacterium]TCI33644.1 lipoate--protein ligase [Exiguobacterium sp. SH4S7]TCI43274.1 lipoate--protein ligase [Exiguobacterium sp. SH5S32]TCI49996.1 lipoate--protein ligase [Exiguobacterium sp. SH1S4]TCI51506.1 lipoate--protein ligase [Exiguobacterium sp. SH1S21]TCI65854.1 lipoate--protein ligase [Exiguobacterium sp. SH0S2]
MKFIFNPDIRDPKLNLAVEEYILKHLNVEHEDYFLFYINGPSIIIGKNQNTSEEVNLKYIEENGIDVVRRLSGGGAVYHDEGNLNFSFITKDDGNSFNNYKKFTQPIVDALKQLGVEAELTGRNDIQVGERKISGNAQFTTRGRMFSHGTLMFNSNIEEVVNSLNVSEEKMRSKGIKSVRSRVANITEFLEEEMEMERFVEALLHSIYDGQDPERYVLRDEDWEIVQDISKERYANWDWNFGKSPKFDVESKRRFPIGTIDVRLNVNKGTITEAKIYGDFFGVGDIHDVEQALVGTRFERAAIREQLSHLDVKHYFGNVDLEELVDLIS